GPLVPRCAPAGTDPGPTAVTAALPTAAAPESAAFATSTTATATVARAATPVSTRISIAPTLSHSQTTTMSCTHLTHVNPLRVGRTRRNGYPCPAERGASPTCVARSPGRDSAAA